MRVGENVELCDLAGSDYRCVIRDISDEAIALDVLEKYDSESEPKVKLKLYQALPKSDKLELIVQKAVELGISEITPVLTSRCVSRWDAKDSAKKNIRLQKIMNQAAKQSGRGIIPQIRPILVFSDAVEEMQATDKAILFYEKSDKPLREVLSCDFKSVSIMTGCEGGFSVDESEYAEKNGIIIASLGKRILRCENGGTMRTFSNKLRMWRILAQ